MLMPPFKLESKQLVGSGIIFHKKMFLIFLFVFYWLAILLIIILLSRFFVGSIDNKTSTVTNNFEGVNKILWRDATLLKNAF